MTSDFDEYLNWTSFAVVVSPRASNKKTSFEHHSGHIPTTIDPTNSVFSFADFFVV